MAGIASEQADRLAERVDLDWLIARVRVLQPWVRGRIADLVYQMNSIVPWASPILRDPAHPVLGSEIGDTGSTNGRCGGRRGRWSTGATRSSRTGPSPRPGWIWRGRRSFQVRLS